MVNGDIVTGVTINHTGDTEPHRTAPGVYQAGND